MKTFSTVLLAILFFTTGCATTGNYDERIRSWEGKNADVLVKTWGKPDATEKQSTGNKIYLYTRLKHPAFAYQDAGRRNLASEDQKTYIKCATYFEVSPQNTVVSTFFRGDECSSKN